ncbi:MAG: M24 family metallopeptidase [Pirellulaceae bacterium]|nr:M24 family metallopeptidase [Pirellulaceae bacterium]
MFRLDEVQRALRDLRLDGWLLYDFRGSNPLARRILGIAADAHTSRRFFCFVPAEGSPRKLVHRIEPRVLEHLPGESHKYLAWQELEAGVAGLLDGATRVAMEYSPRNANPYVSRVDAGTIELVRSLGVEVHSSGDLVQQFESTWTDEQWRMHLEATRHNDAAFGLAWDMIRDRVSAGATLRETEVQAALAEHFGRQGLVFDHPPIVAVNAHSGDPHYAPQPGQDAEIRPGDFVLVDSWAKLDQPGAVYSDLTRVGVVAERVPERHAEIFRFVAAARDAAIGLVRQAFATGRTIQGWQVDQAARAVIDAAGYGPYFIHRLGHNIGQETHGNGANMDNLEMRDERTVMRRTCFSIEPGIYLPEFGVRSEVDVFIDAEGQVHVTGGPVQTEVHAILN